MLLEGTFWEYLQYGSLLLAILTFYFTYKRGKLNCQWWADIPMFLLMIHGIIFYLFLFMERVLNLPVNELEFFTPWSALLRFHGYGTLFLLSFYNFKREKRKWIS